MELLLQLSCEAQLHTCISDDWIAYSDKLTIISQLDKRRNRIQSIISVAILVQQRNELWNDRPNRLEKLDFTLALAMTR
jgi:hypothetical protein